MNTVDVFVVIRDMGYDGEALNGIYQRREDAEYIRDHLEALVENDMWDWWSEYYKNKDITFTEYRQTFGRLHDEFRVEEEDLYV